MFEVKEVTCCVCTRPIDPVEHITKVSFGVEYNYHFACFLKRMKEEEKNRGKN